ncbi:MAG: chemotaxis protein CheC [Candidatus Omnitrophica bacterium]|nr:chemotaxis protein CheC [Candidatus Omnitrophota bacterium]
MLSPTQIDAVKEIASIGAGNAATALAQFVAKKVEMDTPEVLRLQPYDNFLVIPQSLDKIMMIIISVEGPLLGHIMLILEYSHSQYLVDLLMGRELSLEPGIFSELDLSSLKEVTSVMSGAFLRVVSETLNIILKMTPPDIVTGVREEMAELISKLCLWENEPTLCIHSILSINAGSRRIVLNLVFIPSPSSLTPLVNFIGV